MVLPLVPPEVRQAIESNPPPLVLSHFHEKRNPHRTIRRHTDVVMGVDRIRPQRLGIPIVGSDSGADKDIYAAVFNKDGSSAAGRRKTAKGIGDPLTAFAMTNTVAMIVSEEWPGVRAGGCFCMLVSWALICLRPGRRSGFRRRSLRRCSVYWRS